MDALFFLSIAFLNAVMTVVFYKCGRKDLVAGGKNEGIIRGTFCHDVAVTVFFLFDSALYLFADIDLCGDAAGIFFTCALFIAGLIPLLYLRDIRYSRIVSCHVKWAVAAVLFVTFSMPVLSLAAFSHIAAVLLDCLFIIYILALSVIVLAAQCRLTCRFGKENMSDNLFRSTAVISLLFMDVIIFTVGLVAGIYSRPVAVTGGIVCLMITCLHSAGVLRNYPVLARLESRWRKDARRSDKEGSDPELLMASERLSHRLTDYFEVEKPYLSPDLCITEVAMFLMTNKTTLSRAINSGMNCSFREFVNKYRVREAMNLYMRNLHLDMEQLARLSGFRNNTSFTNAFKLNVGKTPGVWCKEYKEMRNEIWQTQNLENHDLHRKPQEAAGEAAGSLSREDRTDQRDGFPQGRQTGEGE